MTLKYPSTHKLIKQICELADPATGPIFQKFIRYFFTHTSLEDLENHPLNTLYHIAHSQWSQLGACGPNDIKIDVYNPLESTHGWVSPYTIVQISLKDKPFLVDSIRMALNRLGLNYNMMIHVGGVLVKRGESNEITQIARYRGQPIRAGQVDAPIYIEVDYQEDDVAIEALKTELERVIRDVTVAVNDWPTMVERVSASIQHLSAHTDENDLEAVEAIAFLKWLLEDNFTFLGMRDYVIEGEGDDRALKLVTQSGLGVLRDDSQSKKVRRLIDLPSQAQALFLSDNTRIIISKTNTISSVHRPVYTDYIGIKVFDAHNQIIGERRVIGLYTSTAYSGDPEAIPFLRHKVCYVIQKSQLPRKSHSGKDLRHILATLPRDDLFQASKQELYHLAMGILHLQERRALRLFIREDAYRRYMSCFVFVPRDIFNTQLLRRIQAILTKAFDAIDVTFDTSFTASILARIHFVVRVDPKKRCRYDVDEIERQLVEACQSWRDILRDALLSRHDAAQASQLYNTYHAAFSAAYRDKFQPSQAVIDIDYLQRLKSDQIEMTVYQPLDAPRDTLKLKVFRCGQTIPLSDALPILENLGFRVLGEEPFELTMADGTSIFINDFLMSCIYGEITELERMAVLLEEAFLAVWLGQAENDRFNHLVTYAYFTWREVSVFRAYTKYLQQIGGLPFSVQYVSETFIHNPAVAQVLMKLFQCYFDPRNRATLEETEAYESRFYELVDGVNSLDEDRTFRRFLDLIRATLRTNFYAEPSVDETIPPGLAFKISPKEVPNAPLPLPAFELFVYSPDFEGVHLRMAKVARGGIRWSDRREDFRTEVLGLMKAQQVKNAVIVPAGAKGGFVVKRPLLNLSREAIYDEGVRCYRGFIYALLSVTDNLVDGKVVHPANVVIRDESDPYLVVAADKGTATFSDIANSISLDQHFWLGDAFASGGSEGYDHKKMGITARGAWVSAERQFQELNINLNEAPVKVVGIGDMSGDVFGNGMLLSSNLKLVAAFNHQHIFIDPNPDASVSFAERKRLFELPRSTWADYNETLISTGGGVFLRSVKSIELTPQMQALLGVDDKKLIPTQLIKAILQAPVDMIWNGGIGTYIKSSSELNVDVGDRANDVLRIDGRDCRARVICEGGNLGLTQLGRIEYELNGGKVNTDFIDNSAGVDCSDHEVNIKILLNDLIHQEKLTLEERNELLIDMTDEVAHLVLRHNYEQNQALSLAAATNKKYLNVYRRMMDFLEENYGLNRALEYLPTDAGVVDRRSVDQGLTKPELSVILAYAKIVIEKELENNELLEDSIMGRYALSAFPSALRERYADEILQHRLYKDIVATQVSNRIVSDMGISFVYTMYDETNSSLSEIIYAYIAAEHIFNLHELYQLIESLDYKVDVQIQYGMMIDVARLVRRATRWFLRNRKSFEDIQTVIAFFSGHVEALYRQLPKLLVGSDKTRYEQRCEYLIDANVPIEIAYRVASTDAIYHALNVIESARANEYDYVDMATAYFAVVDRLDLLWFRDFLDAYRSESHWMILAKAAYKGDMDWVQRELASSVLASCEQHRISNLEAQLSRWCQQQSHALERWESILTRLKSSDGHEFAMLAVALRALSAFTYNT